MNINERLRYLRTTILHLTTRSFGASINMTGGAITNMEKGLRNITPRTINDICRVYNINPDWLTEGTEPLSNDITSSLDIDEDVKVLTKQYFQLSVQDQALVKKIINSLSEKSR